MTIIKIEFVFYFIQLSEIVPESTHKPQFKALLILNPFILTLSQLRQPLLLLTMTSLSLLTNVSLFPNNFIQFQSQHRQQRLAFPRKIKIICSATEQPPQQHPKKKKNVTESGKGYDPVGFVTKLGISNKAFAQFLRERYKQDI